MKFGGETKERHYLVSKAHEGYFDFATLDDKKSTQAFNILLYTL